MADSAVVITAGTGTNIDTRTEATNGNHRQVVVVGDPSTNAGVAPVDASLGLATYFTTQPTVSVVGNFMQGGGSLTAFQGGAPWTVTQPTLPVMAGQAGVWSVTANAGTNLNTSSLALESGNLASILSKLDVSLGSRQASGATLPVTGTLGALNAGGSLTAYQGGAPWLVTTPTLPVVANINNSSLAVTGTFWQATQPVSGTVTSNQGNSGSQAWLVTLATLPIVGNIAGQATVTALQGDPGTKAWLTTLATQPVIANINNASLAVTQSGTWDEVGINDSGNSITIDGNVGQSGTWTVQPGNTPNTTAWLVTMATLPVTATVNVTPQITVSAMQGDPGTKPWLITAPTLPVVTNVTGYALEAGNLATIASNLNVTLGSRLASGGTLPVTGTLGALNAGGSLTAYQGGAPWLVTFATIPVVGQFSVTPQVTVSAMQGDAGASPWLVTQATLPVMANIVNSPTVTANAGTNLNTSLLALESGNLASILGKLNVNLDTRLASGSTLPVTGTLNTLNAGGSLTSYQGGTWTVQPGNTPNTTAWLITLATLPVVGTFDVAGQATVTAIQGDAGTKPWLVTQATLPVMANITNSTLAVTQSGTWDEVGINDSGNSITIDGSVGQSGTWTVQPGNTPNTTAWLVTMATLPVVTSVSVAGQATVTAIQGDAGSSAWLVTQATLPVLAAQAGNWSARLQDGAGNTIGSTSNALNVHLDGGVTVLSGTFTDSADTDDDGTTAPSKVNVGAFRYDDTTPDSVDENDFGYARMSANRNQYTTIRDAAGNERGLNVDSNGELGVSAIRNALPAGTNAIGKLAANSGVDIGDVDITSIAAGDNNIGNVDAIQSGTWTVQPGNTPNTVGWLITAATLPITGTINALNAGGSLTATQGPAGTSAWLVTQATLPVMANIVNTPSVAQSGTWTIQPGNTPNTTGWLVTLATMSSIVGGKYLPTLLSLASDQTREMKLDLFGNQMVNINVPLPNSTRFNRFLTFASMASVMAAPGAGKRLVVREFDFSADATLSIKLIENQATSTRVTVWGPHYFLPYSGIVKPITYLPISSNSSLGVDITGGTFNSTLDIRIETENV